MAGGSAQSASDPARVNNHEWLFPQDPTACLDPCTTPPNLSHRCADPRRSPPAVLDPRTQTRSPLASVPPVSTTPRANVPSMALDTDHRPPSGGVGCQVLLRKEVIQPHLPVRLPCYDFVPIADPTFDSSPPCGLGHWLRVLPTFVT